MTELKTLNDITLYFKERKDLEKIFLDWAAAHQAKNCPMNVIVWFTPKFREMLKQEAIKWVKEDIEDYRKINLNLPQGEPGRVIHNFIVQQRQKWKDRFNLKEEDLK